LGQSWWPFGGVHTWMGVLPLLLHPQPESIASIGMGSGDTVFSLGGHKETREIVCVEIVRSLFPLMRNYLEHNPYGGCKSLLNDPRIRFHIGDGRAFLARTDRLFDIIEIDALRPESPCAGSLYSVEFFSMLQKHLRPGGFVVAWLPSQRAKETFGQVFPFIVAVRNVMVGSSAPIEIDKQAMKTQLASPFMRQYYAEAGLDTAVFDEIINEAHTTSLQSRIDINSDLFPRDEFMVPDNSPIPLRPRAKIKSDLKVEQKAK
jgi:spermidine synthase